MVKEIKFKNKRWILAQNPTEEELEVLIASYKIHPIIAEELSKPTLRPKVESFQRFLYLIAHFPVFHKETEVSFGAETDLVVGGDFILTVSYDRHTGLQEYFELLEKSKSMQERVFSGNTGYILYSILNYIYDYSLRQLDHIKLKIDVMDKIVSKHDNEEVIRKIFLLKRDILNFRRAIKPHETIMDSLELHGIEFFGESMRPYFKDLEGEYYKVWSMLENHKETVEALYDTSLSFLSLRTSEVMKRLTLMAFITFPLTLFVSILSTKVAPDNFFGHPYDFIFIVVVILAAIFGMLAFFKRNRWF